MHSLSVKHTYSYMCSRNNGIPLYYEASRFTILLLLCCYNINVAKRCTTTIIDPLKGSMTTIVPLPAQDDKKYYVFIPPPRIAYRWIF